MAVDPEQAARIAREFLNREARSSDYTIGLVRDLSERGFRAPAPYGVDISSDHWIVYLKPPGPAWALTASTILVLTKADGEVVYFGSANDEG